MIQTMLFTDRRQEQSRSGKNRLRTPPVEKLENVWRIFHINIRIIEKFKPKMMAKMWRIFYVANFLATSVSTYVM